MLEPPRQRGWVFFAWIVFIFAFSSVPATTLSRWNPGVASGWGHFLEYGLLGCLWYWWRRAAGPSGLTGGWQGTLLAATVAAVDEGYQSLVPGRTSQVLDWLVDVLGFTAGVGLSLGARSCWLRWGSTETEERT